jgi:hypothetical protein
MVFSTTASDNGAKNRVHEYFCGRMEEYPVTQIPPVNTDKLVRQEVTVDCTQFSENASQPKSRTDSFPPFLANISDSPVKSPVSGAQGYMNRLISDKRIPRYSNSHLGSWFSSSEDQSRETLLPFASHPSGAWRHLKQFSVRFLSKHRRPLTVLIALLLILLIMMGP